MDENNTHTTEKTNELQVLSLLFSRRLFIIVTTLIGAIGSIVVAFLLPIWFAAGVNVVPPQTSTSSFGSSMGGISSALKEFGLSSMAGVESEGYSFIVILNSRTVKDSIINKYELDKVYDIPKSEITDLRDAFTSNLEITYEKEGNYTITIWDKDPKRAAEMANDYVEIANKKAIDLYHKEQYEFRSYMEQRVIAIDSVIDNARDSLEKYSQKYMIYSPVEQAQSISQAISDLKADQAKYDIYHDFYQNFYGKNDPYAKMFGELKSKTTKKLHEVENSPGFAGNFSMRNAAGVGLEYLRLFTLIESYAKVKAFMMPMVEKARIDESRNVKNLFVIDEAEVPDKKDRPRRSIIVAGSTFGVFVLAVLYVLLIDSYRQFRRKYNDYIASSDRG